ncbi:hypothetical protein AGMMS49992_24690 [Clostridia bacterium]|nr:hypothetical protein AGMMS49992_24690 [Clostridia bacterium]
MTDYKLLPFVSVAVGAFTGFFMHCKMKNINAATSLMLALIFVPLMPLSFITQGIERSVKKRRADKKNMLYALPYFAHQVLSVLVDFPEYVNSITTNYVENSYETNTRKYTPMIKLILLGGDSIWSTSAKTTDDYESISTIDCKNCKYRKEL